MKTWAIELDKEYFEFSCAHFLIFPDGSKERLHGHNYHVAVEIEGDLTEHGLVIDFLDAKPVVRELCDCLDEHWLVPGRHPELKVEPLDDGHCSVNYREYRYRAPTEEIVVLPINNTSVENLATWLGDELHARLVDRFGSGAVRRLRVAVSETPGQRGVYERHDDDAASRHLMQGTTTARWGAAGRGAAPREEAGYEPTMLGVVNLSPESMVRQSVVNGPEQALERARLLRAQGVAIIDLGGRSITPDAPMIDDVEERARLAPVAERLREAGLSFSVDTWSAATARAALAWGADWINFTGRDVPPELLEEIARAHATLVLTYMPYGDAYQMRSRPRAEPALEPVAEIVAFLRPRVEAARGAGVAEVVIDPNLGIVHPETDDYEKIHQQLEILWESDRLRSLGCPLMFYAARKPERLARIMMASAVLHARPEYVRTHEPEILRQLLRAAGSGGA